MTSVSALATPVPPAEPSSSIRENYRLVVPNSPSAHRIARDFVTSLLLVTDHPALADDARLCVTETVTNSHRHTRSRLIRLDVTVAPRLVTVHVRDDQPFALPLPGALAGELTSGRGLLMIDSLAAHWGWTIYGGLSPTSKAVWFTLTENEETG
ncbi:ATP-binding protein [Streptomyces sp. NPDC051569]|uniref:ATP-binding protein n=1 Tax=Streptomyces sp. NPDC051569 TaxID=3365661 RepID=UPI00378C4CAD